MLPHVSYAVMECAYFCARHLQREYSFEELAGVEVPGIDMFKWRKLVAVPGPIM